MSCKHAEQKIKMYGSFLLKTNCNKNIQPRTKTCLTYVNAIYETSGMWLFRFLAYRWLFEYRSLAQLIWTIQRGRSSWHAWGIWFRDTWSGITATRSNCKYILCKWSGCSPYWRTCVLRVSLVEVEHDACGSKLDGGKAAWTCKQHFDIQGKTMSFVWNISSFIHGTPEVVHPDHAFQSFREVCSTD